MNRTFSILALLSLYAGASAGQTLTCPGSTPAGCARLHFHVQAWSPGMRTVTEIMGANVFGTVEACESARKQQELNNLAALKFLATAAPRMKTQPNRYGPCHCDMTRDSGSAVYLDDDRRLGQIRMEQELRNELLHELVEKGLASDSDLALSMTNQPSRLHPESLVRHKPVPATGGSNLLGNARLMDTTVSATTDGETWDKELQLAEITLDRYVADGEEVNTGAHPFVAAELARMRAIALEAASGDSPDKAAILRATSERMRLLAKFGRLIEVAGPRSRLAEAASRAASSEEDRLGLVRSLFGSTTAVHWDPEHPADMVFDLPSAIANDPVAVLRNTGNLYGAEERRMALYAFLLQSPLVESDEPWLSGIAESHLQ